ncbi:MAG: hypothetical protein ACTSUE_25360 [Promethearchaeota archaeon]
MERVSPRFPDIEPVIQVAPKIKTDLGNPANVMPANEVFNLKVRTINAISAKFT